MYRNEQKLKDQHKRESRHVKDQTAYAYFEPQADQARVKQIKPMVSDRVRTIGATGVWR